MKKIAIFASGSGSNAQNIIEYFQKNRDVIIDSLWSNNENAYALIRAEKLGVETFTFDKNEFYKSIDVLEELSERKIDMIVLAGFLWLVPSNLTNEFPIINIHPALLPKYGGKGMYGHHVHEAVINNKEKESGITIHYVNENYDEGDTILQAKCPVLKDDTPDKLAKRVHQLEYEYFPKVIEELLLTASITPKKLSATFNGNDKVYDGTTSANVEAVLEGLISGDDITVSQSALFEDKNAGENKTINITDISLSGDDMKNYSIVTDDSTSTTATINKVLATVTVDNKEVVYNGETHTIDSFSVNGLVNNEDKSVIDSITLQGEGKDAGTHIISALGEDNNYNLEFIDGELKITPKLINVTYSANNKEYDGSTFAIANGSLSGVIQGDDIKAIYSSANFEDEKPANDKNVYIEGISLTGSDSRNYILDKNSYITTASINNSLDSLIASIINDSTINSVEDFNDIDFNSLDINPEKITNIENIITDLLQQGEISFPIINGIVLRVLDGGINMPYGTQRQLILEEDENEKEDEI